MYFHSFDKYNPSLNGLFFGDVTGRVYACTSFHNGIRVYLHRPVNKIIYMYKYIMIFIGSGKYIYIFNVI